MLFSYALPPGLSELDPEFECDERIARAIRLMAKPAQQEDLLYALLDFESGKTDTTFGERWLKKYVRSEKPVVAPEEFSLTYDLKPNGGNEGRHHQGIDGLFSWTVTIEDSPVCSFSFDAGPGGPLITQIQGSKHLGHLLRDYHRERCLISFGEQWAREQKLERYWLQSAANNTWAKSGHFPRERAEKIYDIPAMRCGMRLNPVNGNYTKKLV